jgi:hypothetical protein
MLMFLVSHHAFQATLPAGRQHVPPAAEPRRWRLPTAAARAQLIQQLAPLPVRPCQQRPVFNVEDVEDQVNDRHRGDQI